MAVCIISTACAYDPETVERLSKVRTVWRPGADASSCVSSPATHHFAASESEVDSAHKLLSASLTACIPARRYYQLTQELFMAVTNRIPPCGQNKEVCFRLNVSLVGRHCPVGFSLLSDVIDYARHGDHDGVALIVNMRPDPNRGRWLQYWIHRQFWLIFR